MVDRTSDESELTRRDVGRYLEALGAEFQADTDSIDVTVGNKEIRLSPPETLTLSVNVVERTSRLRADRETVEIELRWKRDRDR